MDPIQKGAMTENRCLRALRTLADRYPDFILGVRQSSPELDARGIDLLVKIGLPNTIGKRSMTVPLEVKSSSHGVAKWRVVHSDLDRAGVLIVYLPRKLTDRKVRRLLYRALDKIRRNSRGGMLYHSLFQRIFRGGSRRFHQIVADIKARRARSHRP